MDAPLLLVDADVARRAALEQAAAAAGFDVVVAASARAGLEIAGAVEPGCVVAELELPDHDGVWLTTALRATPSVAITPVVLVTSSEGNATRVLKSGADVLIERPLDVRTVLAQVEALAAMARRIKDRRAISSMLRRSATDEGVLEFDRGAPFSGDLAAMPTATALTVLELDQRSGVLELRAPDRTEMSIDIASGFVLGGVLGARSLDPAQAIREALSYRSGRFEFHGGPHRPAPQGVRPTTRHLLTAIDESDQALAATPSAAKPVAPPRPHAARKITLPSQRPAELAALPKGEPPKPRGS